MVTVESGGHLHRRLEYVFFEVREPRLTWDDIGGLAGPKEKVKEMVCLPFAKGAELRRMGVWLPADSAAKARMKIVARDANGNPVKGRHMKLTLATTDEYTGTVGAGDFGQEVGATVKTRWRGETDSWGEVEFDYKAGFAAKTVILTAKDLDSGGVTVDYITAFKEASIDIALSVPVSRAAARRGLQYIVKVEASRTELTADGRSRSVIRATVLDPSGAPVANDPVTFTLSSANGSLRTIKGVTDASGVATADYTAGKKIGIVVVTATATLRNASGSVSITLLSDAPAKI